MLSFVGRRIFLACGVTDLRKAINGLSEIVLYHLNMDPIGEAIYVFCNRNRNRVKILEWDGDGFWLHLKHQKTGHFKWADDSESATMTLTNEELFNLLGNPGLEQKLKRKDIKIDS